MVTTNPKKIPGRWRDGYALDYHTLGSDFMGYDEFGHARFDTKRSDAGELLYRLKYRSDLAVVPDLVDAAATFCQRWAPPVDIVIPVTPSRQRAAQPVLILGEALARRLNLAFVDDAVRRIRDIPQLKDVSDYDERIRLLQGVHQADRAKVEGRRVLLFDDLFRSGATMNEITANLYDQGGATDVFALTVTCTRSRQ